MVSRPGRSASCANTDSGAHVYQREFRSAIELDVFRRAYVSL